MSQKVQAPRPLRYHLDQQRERTEKALQQAYVAGYVTDEELDERLELANAAETSQALQVLVDDLPGQASVLASAEPTSQSAPVDQALTAGKDHETLRAIFGGSERAGHWVVPRVLEVQNVFGGITLDFRDAELPDGGTTVIRLSVLFGGVDIQLAPGMRVDNHASAIFGGVSTCGRGKQQGADASVPTRHTIRLEGTVLFGGVHVRSAKSKRQVAGLLK